MSNSVYFAHALRKNHIKIGFTSKLDERIRQLTSTYRSDVVLLLSIQGGRDVEGALHRRFAHARILLREEAWGTEWFRPTADLLAFVTENGGDALLYRYCNRPVTRRRGLPVVGLGTLAARQSRLLDPFDGTGDS